MTATAELSHWIETYPIAEHILEHLEKEGYQPTVENGKLVWLAVLENEMCQAIRFRVRVLGENSAIK